MARPPLHRYRADVVLTIELGAEDENYADARVGALLEELRPLLAKAVRARRTGSPVLVQALPSDAGASAV